MEDLKRGCEIVLRKCSIFAFHHPERYYYYIESPNLVCTMIFLMFFPRFA